MLHDSLSLARGESEKSVARSSALGVWGVFGALSLGVLLLILWTTRSCEPDPVAPPPLGDPFGAVRAVELGWRDCVPEYPDPARDLEARLAERGYVRGSPAGAPLELPLSIEPELEGACGVVVVIAEPTSTIDSIAVEGQGVFPACVGRVATIGTCGTARVAARGTGQARSSVWTFPGLTPRGISATGMPADAVLAHAEAETLLGRHGMRPTAQVLAIGREPSDPLELAPGPAPQGGCAGWVTAAIGLGPVDTFGSGLSAHSAAPERALVLSMSCSDGSGILRFTDPGRDGGTMYSIPYRTGGGGPSVPSDEARLSRIPAVRAVAAREIQLPTD